MEENYHYDKDVLEKHLTMSILLNAVSKPAPKKKNTWHCPMPENHTNGDRIPSLTVVGDKFATCHSQKCFDGDNIFQVIAKLNRLDVKKDFVEVLKIGFDISNLTPTPFIKNKQQQNFSSSKSIYPIESVIYNSIEEIDHYTGSSKFNFTPLNEKHLKYLQGRGIDPLLNTFKDYELKACQYNGVDYVVFPLKNSVDVKSEGSITKWTKVVGYKLESLQRDQNGKKYQQIDKGGEYLNLFPLKPYHNNETVYFVEGEYDAIILSQHIQKEFNNNKNAVFSGFHGANTLVNYQHAISSKTKRVYIIYDNDPAGKTGVEKLFKAISNSFPNIKTTIIEFPSKYKAGYDTTDWFLEGKTISELHQLEKTIFDEYPQYSLNTDLIEDSLIPYKQIYTGFPAIDDNAPIRVSQNTIITGRTGHGKTVLATNLVYGILKHNTDKNVVVISMELQKKEFFQRLMAIHSEIPLWKISKGFKNDENNHVYESDFDEYLNKSSEFVSSYQGRVMIIDDVFNVSNVQEILSQLERSDFFPDYVLIDYINIANIQHQSNENPHELMSKWAKILAKTRGYHIQLVCQANRRATENSDGYARTENLSDSDQYGRDAYTVYSIKSDSNEGKFYLNPSKNRNGKTEEETILNWNPQTGKLIYHHNLKKNDII